MNSPTATHKAQEPLLTTASPLHNFQYFPESRYLLQVLPEAPAINALNSSSCLLAAATSFCDHLMDEDAHANEMYLLRHRLNPLAAALTHWSSLRELSSSENGAQKVCRLWFFWTVKDVVGRTYLMDLPFVEKGDSIRNFTSKTHLMSYHDHGHPLLGQHTERV